MKPGARRSYSKGALVTVVVALLVFGVLAAYLISTVFQPPPNNVANLCLDVLPQNKRAGMKFEALGNGLIKIDLSGQRGVQTGATPQQIAGFVSCLELATKATVVIDHAVRLPLEPVGQVANRWKRESGLQLRLMPGSNDEALNNLRIGAAVGLKENVVGDWCSESQAGTCISCEPSRPTADTNEVIVRLQDGAKLQKRQLDGVWPIPQPNAQSEPWQIVNDKGQRFYYERKHP